MQLVSRQLKDTAQLQEDVLVLDDEGLIPYKSSLGCYPAPVPVNETPGKTYVVETRANL